ncbi:MAG: EpsI family protein [Myxococcales bacterium]|nr:EpsI family protein [Myxococcales bacterium]MDH5534949.1 EpsI family protein [Betaproteobacteria bacterium]
MTKLCVALAFLAANFYVYHFMAHSAIIPQREKFATFPMTIGAWRCEDREEIPEAVLKNLGAADYLLCEYQTTEPSNRSIGVYLGYHSTQIREEGGGSGENSIHPPAHCLPGSGWSIIDNRTVPLDFPNLPQAHATAKRLIVAKGEARQLVYYWYQSRGRVISQDWKKIFFVGWDRATRSRTDGSLIRFTIPIRYHDDAMAEADFRDLAPGILSVLPRYVPN